MEASSPVGPRRLFPSLLIAAAALLMLFGGCRWPTGGGTESLIGNADAPLPGARNSCKVREIASAVHVQPVDLTRWQQQWARRRAEDEPGGN